MSRHFFRTYRRGMGFKAGLLGAALGAGLTYYLFGTDSGNKKRGELVGYAKKLKKRVMEAKDDGLEIIEDKKEGISELAGRMKDHLKEMKDDIEETLG